uniref:Uncharacterized protein n=1 Tax=Siphoviridae sp. cty3u30 TaxID=2825744 RepID=A0A8S5Q8K2_9CAUD|nr:MAG TPA: hypothetical protein [Siphoviridae sp. cty3u30]
MIFRSSSSSSDGGLLCVPACSPSRSETVQPRYCARSWTFATDGVCPLFTSGIKLVPTPLSRQAVVGLMPFCAQYFLIFCTKISLSNGATSLIKIWHKRQKCGITHFWLDFA